MGLIKLSKCSLTALRLNLSASSPRVFSLPGRVQAPVLAEPIRRTVHFPAGAFQLSVPFSSILSVRSITLPCGIMSAALTELAFAFFPADSFFA